MNVVEREAARPQAVADKSAEVSTAAPVPAARAVKLRPLLSLVPYIARYRWQATAAVCALLVAAVATLLVPIAVRRMIDFGFSRDSATLIDSYFTVMIAVVAVLALSSAARYYLVTTLGERIVADLRGDVFRHIVSLSAAYFDQAKTGELLSRLDRRHHPDQGRGRRLGLDRLAQCRAVHRRHRHDGGDEPASVVLRARRHSGDRAAALWLRPPGAAALAHRAGYARRRLRLRLRVDRRGARAASLHQ